VDNGPPSAKFCPPLAQTSSYTTGSNNVSANLKVWLLYLHLIFENYFTQMVIDHSIVMLVSDVSQFEAPFIPTV